MPDTPVNHPSAPVALRGCARATPEGRLVSDLSPSQSAPAGGCPAPVSARRTLAQPPGCCNPGPRHGSSEGFVLMWICTNTGVERREKPTWWLSLNPLGCLQSHQRVMPARDPRGSHGAGGGWSTGSFHPESGKQGLWSTVVPLHKVNNVWSTGSPHPESETHGITEHREFPSLN